MRRPQSAKPGHNGYWGQGSQSDFQQQQNGSKGAYRKNAKLMRPDLTTNDFARILPKKIYQDKQRLYSQALQLKQNLNETVQQNIRLKTRITIMQKQKDKLTKHLQGNRQNSSNNKANSRVNMYTGKSGDKDNMMIRNLKKLVREGKEENQFLKQENAKIKKAIKYTKINQLQIQRKMLQEQNKRIATLLDQMSTHLVNQDACLRQNSDLKRKIDKQIHENQQLKQNKSKYEEYIQELEEKQRDDAEKAQNKQNKLQRQLALNKRKLNEITKQAEDLKKQLNNLRVNSNNTKPQPASSKPQLINKNQNNKPKLTRPMSSNPYKGQGGGLMGVRLTTQSKKQQQNKQNEQIKNIQLENQQLKQQLDRTKSKLEETQRQMQRQKQSPSEKQQPNISHIEKDSNKNISTKRISQNNQNQDKKASSKRQIQSTKQIQSKQVNSNRSNNQDKYYNDDDDNYDQNYQNEFDQKKEDKNISQIDQKNISHKQAPQIDQYRKDFEAEEEEQPLYIKQNSPKKKTQKNQNATQKIMTKNTKDQSNKKKKDKKQTTPYKPNKKFLSQIKQLLTYRMKAQRYPYEQLKKDIESAQEKQFLLSDLKGMFENEPFYLTEKYSDILIQYCFQAENPSSTQLLSNQNLLVKLKKVIEDFDLIQQKEEQEMLLRIAQMVTEYPEELQTAFEKIKNGEQTVAKQDLIEMFQNLELQMKYIQLVIQQLSLCSPDIEHLNFIGFFERFYVENMSGVQNGQIDEQQMQSSSEQVSKHLKSKDTKKLKQIKAQFEDNDDNLVVDDEQRISLGSGEYPYNDNDDVISDDGPI